ncbi:heme ABC transporter ATP-binding protein [Niallia sp. JL1B1071]|uniref:heme ABC transporter ATP-binding protein n=1 Tax=Niallia tiangongensis TaxID=3237105 RepID=UPI0037DCDDF2
MLNVQNLFFQYETKQILQDISFTVNKGEMVGILGPNGSGKTTLMKIISGILTPQEGQVEIKGKPIEQYKTKELAKVVAVLSQHVNESFSYTVREIVSLGRYAHQSGLFQSWSSQDEDVVTKVMKQTGVFPFQEKSIHELSGGEKQRVYLAQALAQEPEILLLDEPTNHLDLSYQKELLDNLREWSRERDLTIVCIFHDLNLAGLYCDRLLLLHDGEVEVDATPSNVLQEERVKRIYQTDVKSTFHPSRPAPQIALVPRNTERNGMKIDTKAITITSERIEVKVPFPLYTLSSGVIGAGRGWYKSFVNRHVDKTYRCDDYRKEMEDYLLQNGFNPSETVGMMTAVYTEDVAYQLIEQPDFSVMIVVTGGVGNAVDAAKTNEHSSFLNPGTINIWIFVNGTLSEQAFVQSVITATEAKAAVLRDRKIKDLETGTIATGTSTDSILMAATQEGAYLEFGGTITALGKCVAQGVYQCLTKSLDKRDRRMAPK